MRTALGQQTWRVGTWVRDGQTGHVGRVMALTATEVTYRVYRSDMTYAICPCRGRPVRTVHDLCTWCPAGRRRGLSALQWLISEGKTAESTFEVDQAAMVQITHEAYEAQEAERYAQVVADEHAWHAEGEAAAEAAAAAEASMDDTA